MSTQPLRKNVLHLKAENNKKTAKNNKTNCTDYASTYSQVPNKRVGSNKRVGWLF